LLIGLQNPFPISRGGLTSQLLTLIKGNEFKKPLATACGLSPVISVMIFAPRLIRTIEDSELKGGSLSISILQQILSDRRHEEPK
jgi:hypothetical protein